MSQNLQLSAHAAVHTRSIERRWDVAGAEPVPSHLPPYTPFEPALVSIWWMLSDGERSGHRPRYNIYAWPADRLSRQSKQWSGLRDVPYGEDMPAWIRELADGLYGELASTDGSADRT